MTIALVVKAMLRKSANVGFSIVFHNVFEPMSSLWDLCSLSTSTRASQQGNHVLDFCHRGTARTFWETRTHCSYDLKAWLAAYSIWHAYPNGLSRASPLILLDLIMSTRVSHSCDVQYPHTYQYEGGPDEDRGCVHCLDGSNGTNLFTSVLNRSTDPRTGAVVEICACRAEARIGVSSWIVPMRRSIAITSARSGERIVSIANRNINGNSRRSHS